ncbi:MAG: anti-sigma factor [Tildeniella nuda ZEHNDER 1965/U140]|jgi:anti-sigma-K factor RskA|nr:anti-sigma factor [Tildeniella nuda ZEHNDER 1965/U140]
MTVQDWDLQDQNELWGLAGEYVLGVLTTEETAAIERLMATNQELRAAVHYWEDRLLGMTAMVEPITPSPSLWSQIERRLPAPEPASAQVAPLRRPPFWETLNFWRLTTAIGAAASIILAVTAFSRSANQAPTYAVVLQSPDDKSPGWIVQGDRSGKLQVIPLAKPVVAPDRSLQLWTKQETAKKPTSLGLVPSDRTVQIPADRLPGLEAGQLFEVTLEPANGSPLDRPTGKILFIGRIAAVQ